MDCALFWKAIGIVLGLFTLYYGFKLVWWAVTPSPTGLEDMPPFGTSLGCMDAPYIYNGSEYTFTAPIGEGVVDHYLNIEGGAVGVITVDDADVDETDVRYELTLRASNKAMLAYVSIDPPTGDTISPLVIRTPPKSSKFRGHCARYDLKIFIPRTLNHVQLHSHTLTHFQYAPEARLKGIDRIVVKLAYKGDNILVPSKDLRAREQFLDVYHGWLVGETSVVKWTEVWTLNGDAVANLKVHLAEPPSIWDPKSFAYFQTRTGEGRSDFTVIGNKEYKRLIKAEHESSAKKNGDVYLTYRDAEFSGKIRMKSSSYSMRGVSNLKDALTGRFAARRGLDDKKGWTHYFGNPSGNDTLAVTSQGWTGLYFN